MGHEEHHEILMDQKLDLTLAVSILPVLVEPHHDLASMQCL